MTTWRRVCISQSKVHAYTWRGLFSTSDFWARDRKHRSRCFKFFISFFIVLHGLDRAKSRRLFHGVVWLLFLFLFSAFAVFWKSWRHLLVASSTLLLTLPIIIMARNSKPGQLSKSNFTFKIVELVSLDVNTMSWTQGICENYEVYNIAGFISCAYRQTLLGSVRAESYKRWQHDLVVTRKHAKTLSGLHSEAIIIMKKKNVRKAQFQLFTVSNVSETRGY